MLKLWVRKYLEFYAEQFCLKVLNSGDLNFQKFAFLFVHTVKVVEL